MTDTPTPASEFVRGKTILRATSIELVEDPTALNVSLLLLSICISAGCLLTTKIGLCGQIYLTCAAAMEIASLVALVIKDHKIFDVLHFKFFVALLLLGVFVPGRMVAWAILSTAMMFITVWTTFDNVCIMQRPQKKGSLASRWAACAVVIYAAIRLLMTRDIPSWSPYVGVVYLIVQYMLYTLARRPANQS